MKRRPLSKSLLIIYNKAFIEIKSADATRNMTNATRYNDTHAKQAATQDSTVYIIEHKALARRPSYNQ